MRESPRTVRISVRHFNEDKVSLGEIIYALRAECSYPNATTISCYNPESNCQCYCPIKDADQYFIPLAELNGKLELEWKDFSFTKPKRVKERTIKEMVGKVAEWRALYIGRQNSSGEAARKYTLEEAADKVGVAKKTLDDYLLQIRAGKALGFDFNGNSGAKVGVLRCFVKERKRRGLQE